MDKMEQLLRDVITLSFDTKGIALAATDKAKSARAKAHTAGDKADAANRRIALIDGRVLGVYLASLMLLSTVAEDATPEIRESLRDSLLKSYSVFFKMVESNAEFESSYLLSDAFRESSKRILDSFLEILGE